jgi:aminoglycoside phosphotransferase (APT) family kinase protein
MLTPALLAERLGAMGMPIPSRIEPVGGFWRHAMWRVEFEPGAGQPDLLLRQPRVEWLTDTLAHEAAALAALSAHPDHGLPVVQEYRLLDAQLLSRQAVLCTLLPGGPGERLMGSPAGPDTARCVGSVLWSLSGVELPGFGMAVLDGSFVPRQRTWAKEWIWRVRQFAGVARARGTDLGPLSQELRERIEIHRGDLELTRSFTLVHGDLQPGNLLFDSPEVLDSGTPAGAALHLTGVIDWECAVAGDPLVDWALPMLVSTSTLTQVIRGYGIDAARAVLALPGAVERIEAYWLTHILERLAFAGSELFEGQPTLRGLAVEQARILAEQALDHDNCVRRRFELALSGEFAGPCLAFRRPSLARGMTRRAVERLRFDAPRRVEEGREWVLAVSAILRAARSESQETADALLKEAESRLANIEPLSIRRFGRPIPNRGSWRAALIGRISESSGRPTRSVPSLLIAVALDAISSLDGAVSDDVLRGLEDWVEGHLAVAPSPEPDEWADPYLTRMAALDPGGLPDPF